MAKKKTNEKNAQIEKNHRGIYYVIIVVLTLLLCAFSFSVNHQIQRADYYKDVMMGMCNVTLMQSEIITLQQNIINEYTTDFTQVSPIELKECNYWLLEEDN